MHIVPHGGNVIKAQRSNVSVTIIVKPL
jgi:hypothetical protein